MLDVKGGLDGVLVVLGLADALGPDDADRATAVMRDIAARCHSLQDTATG